MPPPVSTDGPLVSIITVTRNAAATLERTLQSVLLQTYPYIEYIIIDGASTDGTVNLIRTEADRIAYWVSEPDGGLYDAMNKGLARATGHYVWFLNAGDEIDTPDTLDAIMAVAESYHVAHSHWPDVLYGQAMLIDHHGRPQGMRTYKRLPEALSARDMRLGMVVSHQALLVKRSIAPPYDTQFRIAADIDWTIAVLRAAEAHPHGGAVINTRAVHVKFLLGGTSAQNRRRSWVERWHILRRHFGLWGALAAHTEILFDSLFKPGR